MENLKLPIALAMAMLHSSLEACGGCHSRRDHCQLGRDSQPAWVAHGD